MAIVTTMPFGLKIQLENTTLNNPNGDLTAMLMLSTHDFEAFAEAEAVAEIVADEAVPTGYVRQKIGFATAVEIDNNGKAAISFDDTGFGLLGGALDKTIGGAYLFLDTGNDATSPLIYSVPFETDDTTDGSQYTIRWTVPTMRVSP